MMATIDNNLDKWKNSLLPANLQTNQQWSEKEMRELLKETAPNGLKALEDSRKNKGMLIITNKSFSDTADDFFLLGLLTRYALRLGVPVSLMAD